MSEAPTYMCCPSCVIGKTCDKLFEQPAEPVHVREGSSVFVGTPRPLADDFLPSGSAPPTPDELEIGRLRAENIKLTQLTRRYEAEITYMDLRRAELENQVGQMCVVYEAAKAWFRALTGTDVGTFQRSKRYLEQVVERALLTDKD